MTIRFLGIRRVTHEEDLRREASFWASKTVAERVIAGWALAADPLIRRGEDELPKRTGWTLRRIVRSKS